MQNYIEPIQLENDEQQERSASGTPIYHPNPEVVAAAKEAQKAAPQYKPNSKELCADCTTATLLLPKAQKGKQKNYISVVSYDDKSGSVSAWELPDFGIAHWILFGGIVIIILRGISGNSSNAQSSRNLNSGGMVHQLNFWEKKPEKPTCKPCTTTHIKKVS